MIVFSLLLVLSSSFIINIKYSKILPKFSKFQDFENELSNTYKQNDFIIEQISKLDSYDFQYIDALNSSIFDCENTIGDQNELQMIGNGLFLAYASHLGQKRRSGEPFIIHPVSVANIIMESGADCQTIVAGLLHDTVEDTDLTFYDIEHIFGSDVKKIVEGETKVSKIPKHARCKKIPDRNCIERAKLEQNENLRNMFIAMADDWRIILVKLADRLHNMRTLQYMKPHKQIEISKETLRLFVPLAHRLGLWKFKIELEDLSFKYVYPTAYNQISQKLSEIKNRNNHTLELAQIAIQNSLSLNSSLYSFDIQSRTKSMYSIWKKMSTHNYNIEGLNDLLAIRIIVEPNDKNNIIIHDDVSLCYYVLGIIHRMWTPLPKTLKDYITSPKPNGYRSLHTTVLIKSQPVEIQIRTKEMHQIAEWGTAVHWGYKAQDSSLSWLQIVRTWDSQVNSSSIFMERVRKELLGTRVFVFGPNGQILNLAKGAKLIDAINKLCKFSSELNISVNGQSRSLDYHVENGDIIRI